MGEVASINSKRERNGIEVEIARQVNKISTLNANITDIERHAVWNVENSIMVDLTDILIEYKSQRCEAVIILTQMKGNL